ncbi:SDR family oxidoreductase [Bacillus timonensis]|nr:SDR family oxidoreductase [Bacillus timonensis]
MVKYVLITGASGGIGRAIALKLAEEGYGLYLHYNHNEEAISKLASKLKSENVDVKIVGADLSSSLGIETLLNLIDDPIYGVVYCAGSSYFGLVTDMEEQTIDDMIQLHIKSPFTLIKSILPSMIEKKTGNIIMVSSIWGEIGASCEVLYSMVKGGQNSFVKALAKEVAPSGIRVNAVSPGAINTQMLSVFTEEDRDEIAVDIPMGRIGEPSEIADTVTFLLSKQSTYITGQVISVNGGWHC